MPCFVLNRNAGGLAKGGMPAPLSQRAAPPHFNLPVVTIMISSLMSSFLPSFARSEAPGRETLRRSLAREMASSKTEIERPQLVLASASPGR